MKKVDVLFVHPNGAPFVYQDLSNKYSAIEPPIWAALLANHTRIKGHSTAILDCEAERYDVASSAHAILQYDAKLVAIVVYGQQPSASTQNMHAASLLCNKLQEEKIESKVMLLGLHPSAVSRQTLTRESVDFVCQGEGMYTITSLLGLDMNKTSDLEKVPGLWYRDKRSHQVHQACTDCRSKRFRNRVAWNGMGFYFPWTNIAPQTGMP